jgi:GNAT superfamily N-acetyltransferase
VSGTNTDGQPGLELRVITRPHRRSTGWRPFPSDPRFELDWWDRRTSFPPDGIWVAAAVGDTEVIRVELDESCQPDDYLDTASLGGRPLEIQFLEVAKDSRLQGLGTAMVHAIADRFPNRVLMAFSEGADGFWESLGWSRVDHPEGWPYQPLFVQPR